MKPVGHLGQEIERKCISLRQCLSCHYSNYTQMQKTYAEKHGTPLGQSTKVFCHIKREYVFKNDSCHHYTERHEERLK